MLTYSYQSDNYMPLLVFQYKIHLRLILLSAFHSYVFIFLSLALLTNHSREPADFSNIAAHIFFNLFIKICPLFGQILITCLKFSSASFSISSCSEKVHWGWGWNGEGVHLDAPEWMGDILNIREVPTAMGVSQLYRVRETHTDHHYHHGKVF